MTNPATLFASLLLFASALTGAPLERDLGQGLGYFRISAAHSGLPNNSLNRSCVLDLRYTTTDAVDVAALSAWLQHHATPRTPIFVLANAHTAPALRGALTAIAPHTRLLIIGPATAEFHPDIAIIISAEAERRAYDALTTDTAIATLLNPSAAKSRHDEAAILAARQRGEILAEETEPELTDAPATEVPMVDSSLQRAVQLHRAWLILGAKKS